MSDTGLVQVETQVYTDGSCLGNPGPGGWAAILVHRGPDGQEQSKELSGGYRLTTNNRMELMAAIMAVEALKVPCRVDLHTDSRYVRDALEKGWLKGWQKNGWRTADKKPVKNQDLWVRLHAAMQNHTVRLHWVRGHDGHAENERCDVLARNAAGGRGLAEDTGYTKG